MRWNGFHRCSFIEQQLEVCASYHWLKIEFEASWPQTRPMRCTYRLVSIGGALVLSRGVTTLFDTPSSKWSISKLLASHEGVIGYLSLAGWSIGATPNNIP